MHDDSQDPAAAHFHRNVQTVAKLEHAERLRRTKVEQAIDRLARWAGHPGFPVAHIVWFAGWLGYNVWGADKFDPYPFTFLTMIVSLEAILLTSFVLAAQDHMTKEADRRAKLDLQVDMLAEQELTAILRGIAALAQKGGVDLTTAVPNLDALTSDTRIDRIARSLEQTELQASTELSRRAKRSQGPS
jgi:uncharacterized membrane protein